jgi:hypothetical protein
MKRAMKTPMKTLIGLTASLVLAGSAFADFSGWYAMPTGNWFGNPAGQAVGNWTVYQTNALGNAYVNSTVSPDLKVTVGATLGASTMIEWLIKVPSTAPAGNWTFGWVAGSPTNHTTEYLGYELNGVKTTLEQNGLTPTSGMITRAVVAGDTIGYWLTTDGDATPSATLLAISDFSAPIPEPATLLLNGVILLAGGAVGWVYRRRTIKA